MILNSVFLQIIGVKKYTFLKYYIFIFSIYFLIDCYDKPKWSEYVAKKEAPKNIF